MGSYKQYITNDGEKLLIQALSGEELKFTRVATSTAEIASTDIRELIDLPDAKQTVIPAAATVGRNAIRIQSSFTNKDVTESYLVQAVGLYARIGDGREVLFDIAVADDPCKMTVARASSIDTLVFNFNIAVQQADQITIAVAPGGSLPSEVFYKMFPGMTAPSTEKAGNILMVSETGKWEYIEPDDELSETSKNPVQNKVVTEELKKKQNAIQGKGLSTNDFTDEEKQKLHDIDSGANKTIVDSELSSSSENPIQNKAVDEEIKKLNQAIEDAKQVISDAKALRASLTGYGMVKVTDSSAVTDSTGLALAATEKNATIAGTLANKIAQLNTDFTELTDFDFHKAKGSFYQDGFSAIMSASNGVGNSSAFNVYPDLKGGARIAWSEDFGQNWKDFLFGTFPGAEKANGFYVCTQGSEGDDSKDMFIRIVNRHGRLLDVHFYFTPNASPKIRAFAQNDAGLFEPVWTLG